MIWLWLAVYAGLAGALGWVAHDIRDTWRRICDVHEEMQALLEEGSSDEERPS